MPWYNPMSWFSRAQAMNMKNNANTAILKSALTNYINATKNMNANATRKALNNTRIGLTETYKNRIANAVANAVIAAKKAKVAMAAANAGAVSETAAAEAVQKAATAVNNTANKLANLNKYMNTISGYTNNKNKVNQYKATGRNLNANIALNLKRNGGPKYSKFFKLVKGQPIGIARPNSNIPNVAAVMNFLNNHKNNQNNARNQAARNLATKYKGQNLSTLNVGGLTNAQSNILERAIKFSRNNAAAQTPRANNAAAQTPRANNAAAQTPRANNAAAQTPANANQPKSKKGQVAGVSRNVYYVNGSNNRYIKNNAGKYMKLTNGNRNLNTYPEPANKNTYTFKNGAFVKN